MTNSQSGLWVPDHAGEILSVSVEAGCDDSVFEAMVIVNQAAADWLMGRLDTGTYFDVLDEFGIDPLGFVAKAEDHLELLTRYG